MKYYCEAGALLFTHDTKTQRVFMLILQFIAKGNAEGTLNDSQIIKWVNLILQQYEITNYFYPVAHAHEVEILSHSTADTILSIKEV